MTEQTTIALEVFDLCIVETRGEHTQVRDEEATFWVPTAALDEELPTSLEPNTDAMATAYARWCDEWGCSEECPAE